MLTQPPGGRVALARALLALGGDRREPAGCRDPVVGVRVQGCRVHVDRARRHEPVLVHEPDAIVVGGAPDARVRRHRHGQLAGNLERGSLREGGIPGHVEGQLEAEHVAAPVDAPGEEVPEFRRGRPLPRALLDVAVGQHEPAGHFLQGIDGGVRVRGGLQAVRPVHRGRHPGVDRLDGRQQVPRVHVLRPERLAPVQVVPDEVLGQRPVGAVAAHRGLPHVPVGVDHAWHHDAAGGVDLGRAGRHLQARAHFGDALASDQDVSARQDPVRVVHRQHGAAAEHDGASRGQVSAGQVSYGRVSGWHRGFSVRRWAGPDYGAAGRGPGCRHRGDLVAGRLQRSGPGAGPAGSTAGLTSLYRGYTRTGTSFLSGDESA